MFEAASKTQDTLSLAEWIIKGSWSQMNDYNPFMTLVKGADGDTKPFITAACESYKRAVETGIEPEGGFSWEAPGDNLKSLPSYAKQSASYKFGIPALYSGSLEQSSVILVLLNPGGTYNDMDLTIWSAIKQDGGDLVPPKTVAEFLEIYDENGKFRDPNENWTIDLARLKAYVWDDQRNKLYQELADETNRYDEVPLLTRMKTDGIADLKSAKQEYYYFDKYFRGLFTPIGTQDHFFDVAVDRLADIANKSEAEGKEFKEKIRELKIATLDLFPYRSKTITLPKKEIASVCKQASSRFVISVILKRIYEYEHRSETADLVPPRFIIRSYKDRKGNPGIWESAIQEFLQQEENQKIDLSMATIAKYVLTFSSFQNVVMTEKNLRQVTPQEKGAQVAAIETAEYEQLIKVSGIDALFSKEAVAMKG